MDLDDVWMEPGVWEGVRSFLDHYAAVEATDTVVIAHTELTREAAAVLSVALELRGIECRRVRMGILEDVTLPERLSKVLPLPSSLDGRLILVTLERDTLSHGGALNAVLQKYDRTQCCIIRAISVCPEFFSKSLLPSPADLSRRNATILAKGRVASRLHIETPGGSKLDVTLDNQRYQWLSNRGAWAPGRFMMLPAGEVALFPAAIEGTLVADAAYNTNLEGTKDARLADPVTMTIEGRRVVSCEGVDQEMLGFLNSCFEGVENSDVVGELGFGTNWGVDVPIALNSHINERLPGVHLGFGDHNQTEALAGYACPIHIDMIARGGMIWFDDDPFPLNLEAIDPSGEPHPTGVRADDLRAWDEILEENPEGHPPGLPIAG